MNRLRQRPAPPRYPLAIELRYQAALQSLVRALRRELVKAVDENSATWIGQASVLRTDALGDQPETSGYAESIRRMLLTIMANVLPDRDAVMAEVARISRATSDHTIREWRRIIRQAYGVDVFRAEPWLRTALTGWESQNIALITKMPDDILSRVQGQFLRALQSGATNKSLRKIVSDELGVGQRRAKLIARDQVSKLNGQLTETRQRKNGVKKYTWRTMGDERVRTSHRANNGKTFSWAKPPASTGHPGHDIQCRCIAQPVLPELAEFDALFPEEEAA